jgi:DNA-binding transcriptional MerR regulator
MEIHMMLKISEFSHLAHISGRMLRYYDERGLLKPAYVDPSTGYRYYGLEQLPRFHRLQALKDLGFTLEQIAPLLDHDLSLAELRGMLLLKQAEIQQNIQMEQMRLARIEARLKCIEQENEPSPYEIVIKEVSPLLVASMQGSLLDEEDKIASTVFGLFEKMVQALALSAQTEHIRQPWFLLWSQMNDQFKDMQVEAAIPLSAPISASTPLRVVELPSVPIMACTLHQGTYRDLPQAIQAVYRWAEGNGFYACGLGREIFLQAGTEMDNPSYITEIQLPLTKNREHALSFHNF